MPEATIGYTPGSGELISTLETTTLNGATVSARDIERVILALQTGASSADDISATAPMPVLHIGTLTVLIDDLDPVEVRGNTSILRPVITGSISPAYSVNDVVGGEITLAAMTRNLGGAVINSVSMWSDNALTPELDLMIFDGDLSGGTYTDNGALTLSTADKAKFLSNITISTTDWRTIAGDTWCTKAGLGIPVKGNGVNDLRLIIVTKTTFTLTATTAMTINFGMLRD